MNFWNVQEPTIKGVKHHPRLSDSDRRGLVLDTFGSAVARIPVHERPSFPLGWQDEGVAVLQPSAAHFFRSPEAPPAASPSDPASRLTWTAQYPLRKVGARLLTREECWAFHGGRCWKAATRPRPRCAKWHCLQRVTPGPPRLAHGCVKGAVRALGSRPQNLSGATDWRAQVGGPLDCSGAEVSRRSVSQGPAYTAATQRLGGVGDRGPQRFGKVGHPCPGPETPKRKHSVEESRGGEGGRRST